MDKVRYLDGQAMGRQIRRSIRLYLQHLARRCPLVVMLEDFYWFDESSAALVEHILPLTATDALMVCMIGRGEMDSLDTRVRYHAEIINPSGYVTIPLEPLPPGDSATFVGRLLADEPLTRLRETILSKAEGNPLFIEETIRSLLETGDLVRDRHGLHWGLAKDVDHFQIPNTVHDVIMSRIDRLDDRIKNILLDASVIGQTFLYQVLRALSQELERLDEDLTALQNHDFINEHLREPELEYMFRHAVIQEVAYESILRNRRRVLHHRVGEILETLFANRLDDFSGILAYHFGQAEILEKAVRYLVLAGDKADRLSADSEALHHYEHAVDACIAIFGERLDPVFRRRIARKLGEAYFRRGEHREAMKHFNEALSLIASKPVQLDRHVRREILWELLIQVRHSLKPARRNDRAPVTSATDLEDEAEIYRIMSWMVFFNDQERLLLNSLKSLNFSERHAYPNGIALSASSIAFACDVLGLTWTGERYRRKAKQAADVSGNPIAISTVHLLAGWHEAYSGNWADALDQFAEAATIGWKAGDIQSWGSATWGLCLLSCHRGAFANASAACGQMLTVADESGDRVLQRWGHLGRAMIYARVERIDDAEADFAAALKGARKAEDYQLLPHAAAEFGMCLLRTGRQADAFTILDESRRIVSSRHLRGHHVAMLMNALAEARLLSTNKSARHRRAATLRKARAACRSAAKSARIYRGAAPQAWRLHGTYLWLSGRDAQAQRSWQQSLEIASALGAEHEVAQTRCTIGQYSGDAREMRSGTAILRRLIDSWSSSRTTLN